MKCKIAVMTALLSLSGTAFAQTSVEPAYVQPERVYVIETIKVRPLKGDVMSFHCGNLDAPKPIDVESLLQINDRTQTQQLTNKLMNAVDEACRAGIATIVVERSVSGRSVIWYPEGEFDAAVTSSDTNYQH